MSIQAVSWVLEESEATKGPRCVLFSIANHADRHGADAWPSVATISHEARLSERGVQYALRNLEELGEIRQTGTHKSGTRIYELAKMGGAKAAGVQEPVEGGAIPGEEGVQETLEGVQPTAPEPSLEPSKDNRPEPSTSRPEIETLCELMAELCRERTGSTKIKVLDSWRREMRLLIDRDGRSTTQIEHVIRWVHGSAFWGPNVLGVPKLREKFDTLITRAEEPSATVTEHPASKRIRERMEASERRPA